MDSDRIQDSRVMKAVASTDEPTKVPARDEQIASLEMQLAKANDKASGFQSSANVSALAVIGLAIMFVVAMFWDYDAETKLDQLQKKFDQVSGDYNQLKEKCSAEKFQKQSARTQFDLPALPNPLNLIPHRDSLGLGGKFKSAVPAPKPVPKKK